LNSTRSDAKFIDNVLRRYSTVLSNKKINGFDTG